jgi:multidrug efflux system membrane fusion protein
MQASEQQRSAAPSSEQGGRSSGSQRRLALLLLVPLAAGIAALVWSRAAVKGGAPAAPAAAEARPIPVVTVKATRRDVPVYLDGIGNAVPLATVTVKSQVDGRLDRVYFQEGQAVKKGDLLAQIDPRPFSIALHQAEAALARDTATFKNATKTLERDLSLVEQKLIPQQQVDDQRMTVEQARAAMASDEAAIDNAKLQLDYSRITSPGDGVTGVRLVDPGNIVHAGDAGGIVVVTQLDPMAVLFTLPEDDLPRVSAALAKGPLTVEAFTRDASKRIGTGKLTLIDNQVNQATATIRLKAIFPNPDRALWPNAFLKVRLLVAMDKDALVVPAVAVQRGPKGTFVYVVDAEKKASPKPVTVEETEDDWAIVGGGLSPNDTVVVEGQNQLRPGAKVAPRGPATAGAPVRASADAPPPDAR